jgi:hypothetical protein
MFSHGRINEAIIAAVMVAGATGINTLLASVVRFSTFREGLWYALLFGELTLATLWVYEGRSCLSARIMAPLAFIEMHPSSSTIPGGWLFAFLCMLVASWSITVAFRIAKARIYARQLLSGSQFSVRQLLSLTTCTAIITAFVNWRHKDLQPLLSNRPLSGPLMIVGCFAIIALLGVWHGSSPTNRLRLSIVLVTIFGLPFALMAVIGWTSPNYAEIVGAFTAEASFIVVSLLLFRYLRYRLKLRCESQQIGF